MTADAPLSLVTELNQADFAKEVEQASTPVFIDFWAPWCGPCVALAPLFHALAETYGDQIKFVKVNIDDNKELFQRLGLRSIPSLLLFKDGQVVERVVGGRHKGYFSSLLDKYVQRPVVAAAKKPAKSFSAFHSDAGLRHTVAERVRAHIEAGRIIPSGGRKSPISDTDQQRYCLMGAALETADVQRFEDTLGIPASVGRLQEAVHSLLIQHTGERDDMRFHLDPPHSALPVEWWGVIPRGADLQALPSHFIHWLLRGVVDNTAQYRLYLSDPARSALLSLAQLHARTARGDVPSVQEWEAVRTAVGSPLLKPLRAGDPSQPVFAMFEHAVQQLAWPADELDNTLADVISAILLMTMQASPPDGYTSEQWAEQVRLATELDERAEKAVRERFPSFQDMTPAQRESVREELEALEEVRAAKAFSERLKPVTDAHGKKLALEFAERMHAGLMQSLLAAVSSGH